MADWDKDWRRKREEEEEREREFEEARAKKTGVPTGPMSGAGPAGRGANPINLDPASAKFDELMQRAEPLIEQVHNLYNMFFAGAEKRAPIERRQLLDQIMDTLFKMAKPTAAMRFKHQALHHQYMTYRDRWDKKIKELEAGKIRRSG